MQNNYTDNIPEFFALVSVVSVAFMYVYLIRIDKNRSWFVLNVVMDYVEETKKRKGRIGWWFYLCILSGISCFISFEFF